MNNGNIYATMVVRSQAEAIKLLEKENQQLKEQNNSLKTRIKTIKRRRKLQTQKLRKYRELITNMQNKLQRKNKVIEKIRNHTRYLRSLNTIYFCDIEPLEEILDKYKGDN